MPPMPPPPPPERKGHEKMVDLDNDKDVPPPPDAKFLAQKNNRAEVETRAEETNMVKAQKGEGEASSKSERDDKQVGGDKAKIAQLEEEKSKLGRSAPDVTPHPNPELSQPKDQPERRDRSLLALRDPTPKQHELTPETADLSLPHAADGEMPLPSHAARGTKSDPSHLDNAKRVKLAFTAKDYEYLFGADAAADRKLAQQTRSTRQGKFQKRLARVQSAVENFVPEVKPGNQTALNTRAAPFAAYLARMHRSIHELWGFGQLEEWDEKAGSSPYNNRNLVTELEFVLNGDGTIDKVGVGEIVRPARVRRRRRRRRLHRGAVPRSSARDPLGQRQDLRSLALLSGRAPVRDLRGRSVHPRECLGRRRQDGDGARSASTSLGGCPRSGWSRARGKRASRSRGSCRRGSRWNDGERTAAAATIRRQPGAPREADGAQWRGGGRRRLGRTLGRIAAVAAGRASTRAAKRGRRRRAGGRAALVHRAGCGRHLAPSGDGGAAVQDQRQGGQQEGRSLRDAGRPGERGDPTAPSLSNW